MTKPTPTLVWGWLKRPHPIEAARIEAVIRDGTRGRTRRRVILSFLSNGNRLALNCEGDITGRDLDLRVLSRKGKIEFVKLECSIGTRPSSRRTYAVSKQEKD